MVRAVIYLYSIVIIAGITLSPSRALAGVLDQFGLGPDGASLGNATVATPNPAYAAYYNPAGVADKGSNLSVGLVEVDWKLNDLNGGYRPANSSLLPQDQYRASKAQNLEAVSFGFQKSLPFNLGFGISGLVPKEILAIHGSSGEEVQYLNYSDRQKKPEIYTAIAMKHPIGLAFGAGAYATVKAKGEVQAGLSNVESRGRINLETEPVVIPHFGLRFSRPIEDGSIALGAFYRKSHTTDVELDTQFVVTNDSFTLPAEITTNLAAFHDPTVMRLGVSFEKLGFGCHLAYEKTDWSDYTPPILELSGKDIATLTGNQKADFTTKLKDAQAVKVGASYQTAKIFKGATFRMGLEQHSGTTAKSSGRNPVVDVGRNTLGLGVGFVVVKEYDEAEAAGETMSVDFTYQYSKLKNKTFKDSDGQSFTAGGSIQGFLGGLSHAF